MELAIGNTQKILIRRILGVLPIILYIICWAGIGYRGAKGWYNGSDIGYLILFVLAHIFVIIGIFIMSIEKVIGVVIFCNEKFTIEHIKYKISLLKKEVFCKRDKQINFEELMFSEIFSIQLLLDSGKEKPIYTREYFNGAENNWLIIKEKSGKIHKIEILIKSLEMEKAIINYLEQLKEKNIEISYGTKRKTFLHTIRCAF